VSITGRARNDGIVWRPTTWEESPLQTWARRADSRVRPAQCGEAGALTFCVMSACQTQCVGESEGWGEHQSPEFQERVRLAGRVYLGSLGATLLVGIVTGVVVGSSPKASPGVSRALSSPGWFSLCSVLRPAMAQASRNVRELNHPMAPIADSALPAHCGQ
jgi:hypothetical protein